MKVGDLVAEAKALYSDAKLAFSIFRASWRMARVMRRAVIQTLSGEALERFGSSMCGIQKGPCESEADYRARCIGTLRSPPIPTQPPAPDRRAN